MGSSGAQPDDLDEFVDATTNDEPRLRTKAADLKEELDTFRTSLGRSEFVADVPELDLDLGSFADRWERLADWLSGIARAFRALGDDDDGVVVANDFVLSFWADRYDPPEAEVKVDGDRVIIDAGAGDDEITVRPSLFGSGVEVTVNGEVHHLPDTVASDLVIRAGPGDNKITVAPDALPDLVTITDEENEGHTITVTPDDDADPDPGDTILVTPDDEDDGDIITVTPATPTLSSITIDAGNGDNEITTGGDDVSIRVGDGDNEIHASGDENSIVAGDGDNRITTLDGNDTITVGDGENEIVTGTGDSTIRAGDGDNAITTGHRMWDALFGARIPVLVGGGNNVIETGDGNNEIVTGTGHDTVTTGQGNDKIQSFGGSNTIESAGGSNEIRLGGDGYNIVETGDGNDKIYGSAGNDTIHTTGGRNYVDVTAGGNNTIETGDGNDVIYGGEGNDIIRTEGGDNYISAVDGDNHIFGGTGNDIISGGLGDNMIDTGGGSNIVYTAAGDNRITANPEDRLFIDPDDRVVGDVPDGNITRRTVDLAPLGAFEFADASPGYETRVRADLVTLASSPVGREMIEALAETGETVTLSGLPPQERALGTASDEGEVRYTIDAVGGWEPPIMILQHELTHVYNFYTDTMLDGYYIGPSSGAQPSDGIPLKIEFDADRDGTVDHVLDLDVDDNGVVTRDELDLNGDGRITDKDLELDHFFGEDTQLTTFEPNSERQATGLPVTPPDDRGSHGVGDDPSMASEVTNHPDVLNVNALLREMGLPLHPQGQEQEQEQEHEWPPSERGMVEGVT